MGSFIELNDTLQITTQQGFPSEILNLEKHRKDIIRLEDLSETIFSFMEKPNARIYHIPPVRCFLVHNIEGKWLFWGKVHIIEQKIVSDGENSFTSGKFKIIEIYEPEYQTLITKHESIKCLSYF